MVARPPGDAAWVTVNSNYCALSYTAPYPESLQLFSLSDRPSLPLSVLVKKASNED